VTGRFKSIITVETKEEALAYYALKAELFDGMRAAIGNLCKQRKVELYFMHNLRE
jgi:hypothetical protein